MNYRQLQLALKPYKNEGKTTIRLNSKKALLQAEYERLTATSQPLEERLMEAISELAPETNNYVPFYQLRGRVEASRQEFDEALYALIRADKVDCSTLVESHYYTVKQFDAGIPQPSGGPLFFAMLP